MLKNLPKLNRYAGFMRETFIRLATLVVSIANHANLKQADSIGRMAILYFEEVSRRTLLMGLAGINSGRAFLGREDSEALSAKANQTASLLANF